MAHELWHDRELVRHRGALLAGQEPRRQLPLVIPGCRSARGRRARHAECKVRSPERWLSPHSACRVPRLCAPLPERGKVAPPDKELLIGNRALWSAGTRAHVPVALPRNARERSSSLKARALYITALCTPAPGDPGFRFRRGMAGWPAARASPACQAACAVATGVSTPPARPRRAPRAHAQERDSSDAVLVASASRTTTAIARARRGGTALPICPWIAIVPPVKT